MVRETRHLWVGNLPENIREDRIREHFKRYGRVQSVKLLPRVSEEKAGEVQMACTVAFMDIKSASKAHNAELKIDDRTLNTEYYEPAAIPSAASPHPGTPPPYSTSTSPGATRFPNGHGSSDEHGFPAETTTGGTTPARFYDRTSGGVGAAPTTAPEGGSGTCRGGRNRDRFRGGGVHRGASVWGTNATGYADTSRYNNSNERSQSDTTGYSSAPSSDTNDRRNSDNVRKKAKSRSGSRTPSPNGSTSSRSPSRSRSRSSSSSSSSSTSRTSSTSSPRSRHRRRLYKKNAAQITAGGDDRRPLGICVRNLPLRSSDTSLKDGLFHEYKKHGKVTWVKIVGQNADRHAIVCFKKPEDAEKALEVSYDKLFFGCKIEVAPHSVCDIDEVECRYESEIDEYNPKATRTLFIGNLEKDVTASDLRKHFDQFGEIIEIDIKKQGAVSSYAFCQYSDIVSVVKAIRKMDGEHLGNNRIKLGFGKSMAYNCVWIDGVADVVTEKYLRNQFETFGAITKCIIDREKKQALVFYEHVSQAQLAVNKMRGFVMKNVKLQVDFASRECQECFFERLEKQGTVLDRAGFEDRRDSSTRSFESSAPSRISRYDTPTRPRTSSYSSRSSAAAVASPGTPGSATPRARARVRYYEYDLEYNAAAALEVGTRHATSHRSYDEYSQGSAASHEDPYDPYDHPVGYLHDSPGHLDPLDVRVVQVETVPYAPHDIRNLQKERVHLLEQLEECPSSGDELISPKKRLKLDLLDPTVGDVIIEANRDHRKVMEVRRLSETTIRHHSRRPSVDNRYAHYAPHTVGCKRRRTGGSDGGVRSGQHGHYADHSEGSDQAGSRPGTPLCDENPEFPPGEPPKRTTRERDGPMLLPLPKWAAQVRGTPEFQRGTISVAGIKGQKEHVNPLASPPPAATSPRVQQVAVVRPPSPAQHVPPPASPPPRPPSLSSNSSDSDGAGGSPSLEERIKQLEEKYEKWSGSRALSAAGNDALAMLDANREKYRQRHKLLEIQDLKEVQPSEIVKSVMAKRSVFDEDLKRLESVGEKYEPKEFGLFSRLPTFSAQSSGTSTPVNACLVTPLTVMAPSLKLTTTTSVQLPKTPTMLSPRSSGTALPIPASRGLQYPFPSHPPMQMSPAPPVTTTVAPPPPPPPPPPPATTAPATPPTPPPTSISTTSATVRTPSLGENRLKPTVAAVPGDSRTCSIKNRSVVPIVSDVPCAPKPKPSEKVTIRRNSSCTSPRADVKTRRNSDTSARRIDDSDKFKIEEQKLADKAKEELEKQEEKDRIEKEKQEKQEKQEKERLERESELEKERIQREKDKAEKEERDRKEEAERKAKEERRAKEEKERKRSEERSRNKDPDNHYHERSSKNHSDKHRENNHHPQLTKDIFEKHDSIKAQIEREAERRKESIKENRDNNIFDKHKHLSDNKDRAIVETRHMSLDLDNKQVLDPNRRKERNNSLPATDGLKRRMSSHELEGDEAKKAKLERKPERRDSKDSSKGDDRSKKNKHHKNNSHDKPNNAKEGEERRKDKDKEREERHKHKHKLEKQKSKSKTREIGKEERNVEITTQEPLDKDFLAKLDLRSNDELQKDKIKSCSSDKCEDKKKFDVTKSPDDKMKHKPRIRKLNSSDSDSDEPKKHSIFDIVDDGPPYISMYDKVKARSCKNMQKQEEEKRQEKIKAKFSQLKLSRARREEKKRSTSWDEDSDSDKDPENKLRKSRKVIDSSDESQESKLKRKEMLYSDSDNSLHLRPVKSETDEEVKVRNQIFKAKTRIQSDSSDEEFHKHKINNKDFKVKLFDDDTDDNNMEVKPEKITSVKSELERLVKKERRNSKFHEHSPSETFDLHTEPSEVKTDRSVFDNTSDEDELKKEKEKREKKHKKKQKKKHSSSEESCKLEADVGEERKHHDKKPHSKKEKKRDKTKEGRDKPKKSKKSRLDDKGEKREGKMENIFGSLSEDSEPSKELFIDENAQAPSGYNTDSDKEREEHKRKKEKRRREKERRLQEAAENPRNSAENSMDFADMGKQLEAAIKDDTSEVEVENNVETTDAFPITDDVKKEDRKEVKEKKKKRKKSKDEKKHHHHHHHHHDKSKPKPEVKVEIEPVTVEQPKEQPSTPTQQSLPSLMDIQCSSEIEVSPTTRDMVALISPIPSTPTTSARVQEIADDAVKSIADVDVVKEEVKEEVKVELDNKDKARAIISQEETEDAVAALLGESFGSSQFEERYVEEIITTTEETVSELVEEEIPQYDEEMRKAVQSLEVDGDISKPDTPQSEHELQIDTDTEETDETPRPKTPDTPSFTPLPKTPDVRFYSSSEKATPSPVTYKTLNSPPSLTPIKPAGVAEVKKNLEQIDNKNNAAVNSVIAQNWQKDKEEVVTTPPAAPVIKTFTPPPVKSEPNYPPLAKLSPPTVVVRHNLPAQSPVPCKQEGTIPLNRLPITPVMVTKPIQATTVFLPQAKVAQLEPPKLVTTAELRQERPRMVFQAPAFAISATPRVVLQANIRPAGLLVPTRPAYPFIPFQPKPEVIEPAQPCAEVKEEPLPEEQKSTPSPVIVANPEVKPRSPSPLKLAIEKVTEELNLSLEKKEDEVEVKEEVVPIEPVKEEEAKPEEPAVDKPKEDDDFWSAKDSVNIDSVIKTLADEISDGENKEPVEDPVKPTTGEDEKTLEVDNKVEEVETTEDITENEEEPKVVKAGGRRGRGGRPRGTCKQVKPTVDRVGIQTRRGKLKEAQTQVVTNSKRGRGGKVRGERKSSKSESDCNTNDVYEFREDSDDSKEQRPRLVLTIKSTTSSTSNAQTTAIVKEITKDGTKEIGKKEVKEPSPPPPPTSPPITESKDEFTSPQTAANTRKSRRLAQKTSGDADDKKTPVTRAAANQRRSGRQPKKQETDSTPRKSPRGRKPSRRASEAAGSSSEDTKDESPKPTEVTPVAPPSPVKPADKPVAEVKKVESVKTAMLKRFKGEMNANKPEPTNLIDPVTGMIIPMRESEEGKYIPLPGTLPADKKVDKPEGEVKTVIAQPQPVTVVQQPVPKVHPLKAHVLSSQAAKAVVSEVQPKPLVVHQAQQPVLVKSSSPVTSSVAIIHSVGPISPRPGAPPVIDVKTQVKPVLSPLINNHKPPMTPKEVQIANWVAHMKQQQVIMGPKAALPKPHSMHLPGQVASPPISKAQPARIERKGVMEPPKIDVNLPNLMLGRPNLSPSGAQARLPGLPVPAFEASLMAEARAFYNRTSPPPAHQNAPHSPKGEPMTHFPPGTLRPDLSPAHYMHPQHMMYQQFLRQQQQQQHFQRSTLEKVGEEGEEAPVGLPLSGRGAAVPHHSPHDRATESPAIGQVYSTLTARLPPYHPGTRYFDQQPAEPPPAHRPLTSHDRAGLAHIPPLGTPDRPLGAAHAAHLIPDRPSGVIPDRPLSAHLAHERVSDRSQTMTYAPERSLVGAGLGAAGNLMGAVAKHIGVEAPASQRGIQAATPPLASQVPPQAESLFMLLKQYPLMWQGLLALKMDQAAVQMYYVSGNDEVARCSLPKNTDGSTPPLRIFQRMRLEPMQVEGVARKIQMEKEHCMLLALPCGHDHMDVLKQSTNLTWGFITYLQQKQAAGIVNVAAPGTTHPPAYVVHIFPSCDFVNENLRRIAPSLLERVADIAHLLIVITTV